MKNARHRLTATIMFICLLAPLTASPQEASAPLEEKSRWMPPPAPIEGKWKFVGCAQAEGMVIEFTITDDPQPKEPNKPHIPAYQKKAKAVIVEVGQAQIMGYQKGETLFDELKVNFSGAWRGKFRWRSAAKTERMDPVYMTMSADQLVATMTTNPCFKTMERVR